MLSSKIQPYQDYFFTLQQILDLAMQTAKTASAEGNHKVVIQAIREGTRAITLILKMAQTPEPIPASLIDPGLGGTGDTVDGKRTAPGKLTKKWEKNGKLPGKTPFCGKINKENRTVNWDEKNGGKKSPQWRLDDLSGQSPVVGSGNWIEDLDAGRLSIDFLNVIGAGRPLPELLPFPGL